MADQRTVDRVAEHRKKAKELADQVKQRLVELGITATQAARSAGLPAGFITDILSGRKASVQGRNLERLANALQWTTSDLLALPPMFPSTNKRHSGDDEFIPVIGEIAPGYWVDTTIEDGDKRTFIPHNPAYAGIYPERQFDVIVKGTSLQHIANEGQHIRCLNGPDIADALIGSLYIFERFQGNLRERLGMIVRQSTSEFAIFGYASDDPRWSGTIRIDRECNSEVGKFNLLGEGIFVYRNILPYGDM